MIRKPEPVTAEQAEQLLFPTALTIVSADLVATFTLFTGRLPPVGFDAGMLDGHARAVATPALQALFRSPEALADVETAAASYAARIARDPAEYGAEAVTRYKRAIAAQLAAVVGHELHSAATVYLAGCVARDQAATERATAAERERLAAEQAAAEQREVAKKESARLLAEAEEAKRAQSSAEAVVAATLESHRVMRARWFVAELQASEVKTLRVRDGRRRGKYDVGQLISHVPSMSLEELADYGAALTEAVNAMESW